MTWGSQIHYILIVARKRSLYYEIDGGQRRRNGKGTRYAGKTFTRNICRKCYERPNVGGVSVRSRNGAPSGKECLVNGPMTKVSN